LLCVDAFITDVPQSFVVLAWTMIASLMFYAVFGSREIVVYSSMLVVHKRGRELWRRPLSDLTGVLSPGAGIQILRFSDGKKLWWSPMSSEGAAALDHLTRVLQANTRPANSAVNLVHLDDLSFPANECVSCRAPATRSRSLLARRGLSGIVFSSFVVRHVTVPVCGSCSLRRTGISALLLLVPFAVFFASLKVGARIDVVAMGELGVCLWLLANFIPMFFVANWGYRVADYFGLGVALGSLDATHSRVPVYRRTPQTKKP
jgi:hypothetical protein